jgi:macrolide transport system ATP-binding/permease protein
MRGRQVSQLSARSLTHAYHGRTILAGVDVIAGAGERLGLVGQNGAGKSTLLRLLAGRERPDGGSVVRHGDIGYLPQKPELPDGGTIGEAVDAALSPFRTLEARMRDLEARMAGGEDVLTEYGEVLAEYEDHDGWSADARAAKAMGGLGLGDLPPERPVATLSGGQRARLALALVLVRAPEILLLDEPTNHLDDDALAYLEGALREHSGVLVAASHDRAFLDAVCTSILDLDPSFTVTTDGHPAVGPSRYSGAYSEYLTGKAAARARWEQAYATWNDEVNALQAAVKHTARQVGHANRVPRDNDKFAPHFFAQRSDAAVARRVRDSENRLERLREQRIPKPPKPLAFSAALTSDVPTGVLISAREIDVPGRVAIDALDVNADTRLLVTGPNGAGKSSLLAVLTGALEPERGRVMLARGLRIGWLPQEGAFPDPTATALQVFAAGRAGAPEDHQADLVGLGLLPPRDIHTPVGRLSVGQQRRLALARLLTSSPHVLLLDEPTNHLSLTLVEELEAAVLGTRLPVVAVSHDRWLRRRWTGEELRLASG